MRRAPLVLALLLLVPLPGCLDTSTYSDLWTDLEAKPEFEERSLFNDRIEFSPAGAVDPNDPPELPPSDPTDASAEWTRNFTVPQGTRSITVLFTVNFSNPDDSSTPTNPPDGQARVFVEGPTNASQNVTYRESASGGFDFQGPTPGDWTLGIEAIGQGNVVFRVVGDVPVNRTA